MAIDTTETPPHLIFFEIVRTRRHRGLGRRALLTLLQWLRDQGAEELFVQTGRPAIYEGMGFRFRTVARSGLVIDIADPLARGRSRTNAAPITLVHDDAFLLHATWDLPESPERLSQTIQALRDSGLLEELAVERPRLAAVTELERVHSSEHVERVRQASRRGTRLGRDTPTCSQTFDVARLGFGGALLAGERIEDWRRAFVLCRPPGHHATADRAMGFCFFNNAAGLALDLRLRGYRPMVIDWDAHHGNGTQDILYERPIPFVSIHQRDLYPWTGFPYETGAGEGSGFNHNIQVPPLCTDQQYLKAFERVPALVERHRPNILIVSAGQDGHRDDKLSGMLLSDDCYRTIAATVRALADEHCEGRVILLLEGGYSEHLGRLNQIIVEAVGGL